MTYKYSRKKIAERLNLILLKTMNPIDAVEHLLADLLAKAEPEKCDCKTKYCKHYKSDFDKYLESQEEPKIEPLLDNDWKARHRELTEMVSYQDLVFKTDELVERVNKLSK